MIDFERDEYRLGRRFPSRAPRADSGNPNGSNRHA